MTRLGRAAHQRLLAGDFMGLTFLGLDAVPNDGDEPAYDLTLSIGLLSNPELGTERVLYSKDDRLAFEIAVVQDVIKELATLLDWDFGYATQAPLECSLQAYISSYTHGTQSEDEEHRISLWYDAPPEARMTKPRNIYLLSLLNSAQLNVRTGTSESLRERLLNTPGCTLQAATPDRLWLVTVEPEAVLALRSSLTGTGALIEAG